MNITKLVQNSKYNFLDYILYYLVSFDFADVKTRSRQLHVSYYKQFVKCISILHVQFHFVQRKAFSQSKKTQTKLDTYLPFIKLLQTLKFEVSVSRIQRLLTLSPLQSVLCIYKDLYTMITIISKKDRFVCFCFEF